MVLTDIIPFVQAQIKLCPLPMVMLETYAAAKKFIQDTRAWNHTITDIKLVPNTMQYELNNLMGTKPASIYAVWLVEHDSDGQALGRHKLSCVRGEGVGSPESRMRHTSTYALPRFWTFRNDLLELWPVGDFDGDFAIEADVCLTLDGKNPALPDWLDEHEIAYGALARLYAIAGQDWFSADLANYYEDKFAKAIASKRIERIHGGMTGSLTIQAPQLGGYL